MTEKGNCERTNIFYEMIISRAHACVCGCSINSVRVEKRPLLLLLFSSGHSRRIIFLFSFN
jgi:hypothetical protein